MAKVVIDKTDKRFPVGKYAPEKGSKAKVKTLLEVLKDDVTYVDVMIRKGEVELRGQAKIAFESRIRGVKSRLTAAQVEKEEGTPVETEEAVVEGEETSEETETSPEDLGEAATEETATEEHPGEEAVQEQPEPEKTEDAGEPDKEQEADEPAPSKKSKSNKKK